MKQALLYLLLFEYSQSVCQLQGYAQSGNAASVAGATWSYQATVNGINYDLEGILYTPTSTGPLLPAVIINHGTGGNVNSYSKLIAQKMVQWGYVCIATNHCHSANVPEGAPGYTTTAYYGASPQNILRGMKCRDILASFSFVDTNCIAVFGHSRGSWTTTGMAGLHPTRFRMFAHTAGGVHDQAGSTQPTFAMGNAIQRPYMMHHGDSDNAVPLAYDISLDSILQLNSVPHQLYIYSGYTHAQIAQDSLMLARTRVFFSQHGCADATALPESKPGENSGLFPNPSSGLLQLADPAYAGHFRIFNVSGMCLMGGNIPETRCINICELQPGIYILELENPGNLPRRQRLVRE